MDLHRGLEPLAVMTGDAHPGRWAAAYEHVLLGIGGSALRSPPPAMMRPTVAGLLDHRAPP